MRKNKKVHYTMRVSNISFGTLLAVTGKEKRMKNIDKKVSGQAMIKDVTSIYETSFPSGTLAQAARNGDRVKLYITGEERSSIENKKPGWQTLNNLLENIQDYIDANRMSLSEVVNYILKRK